MLLVKALTPTGLIMFQIFSYFLVEVTDCTQGKDLVELFQLNVHAIKTINLIISANAINRSENLRKTMATFTDSTTPRYTLVIRTVVYSMQIATITIEQQPKLSALVYDVHS